MENNDKDAETSSNDFTSISSEEVKESLNLDAIEIGDVELNDVIEEIKSVAISAMKEIEGDTLDEDLDEDDEDLDETLVERLVGLTEMFPEGVRNGACCLTSGTFKSVKWLFNFSKSASWIFFSSATLLVAPLILEIERSQLQKQLQREMLLGPGSGGASSMGMPIAPTPGV